MGAQLTERQVAAQYVDARAANASPRPTSSGALQLPLAPCVSTRTSLEGVNAWCR